MKTEKKSPLVKYYCLKDPYGKCRDRNKQCFPPFFSTFI